MTPRHGTVLLFMLGLITVMLVLAYAFVTSMQMASTTAQAPRRQRLARLAADMGMQHAIAVCMHAYAMPAEKRDGATVTPVTRIDAPHKNVFQLLSPRVSSTDRRQQPPLPWDLGPDVPFQDLLWAFNGSYHSSGLGGSVAKAWADGWTMDRGYARLIEANRFGFVRGAVYDPATYDDYDLSPLAASPLAYPNPAPVATPFPPVDPFVPGKAIVERNALDHPLWLDADFRPVADLDDPARGAVEARYRLRYAVDVQDMSQAVWLNTDLPWIPESAKAATRSAYGESVAAAGAILGRYLPKFGFSLTYGTGMESVLRGYGQYGNSRFDPAAKPGLPLEWPERGGQPMWYRGPITAVSWATIQRAIHCVHGSPFASWYDPDPANPGQQRWIGSPLTSWNDLAFALKDHTSAWQENGETDVAVDTKWGYLPVRADPLAQRAATPFGRPYAAATDNPWAVNVLTMPMKLIEAMVAAYVPPSSRALWTAKKGTSPQFVYNAGPADGPGADLFTDAFRPSGRQPFAAHPAPANRDYWTSAPAVRPNHTAPADTRPAADRYPGKAFFPDPLKEARASCPTVWKDLATDPKRVQDDPAFAVSATGLTYDPYPLIQADLGADGLGRHIVFSDPSAAPAVNANTGYYSSHLRIHTKEAGESYIRPQLYVNRPEFTPMTPFGVDNLNLMGATDFNLREGQDAGDNPLNVGMGGGAFSLFGHDGNRNGGTQEKGYYMPAAPNSYWHRLALAYVHAVVVSQIANLAWADPQDARAKAFWPTYAGTSCKPAGIIYNPLPGSAVAATMRKGPTTSWDPAAAHYADEEMVDRQFLANLGESFDQPGRVTTTQALALPDARTGNARPPRFSKCLTSYTGIYDLYSGPDSSTYAYGSFLTVGEYRVTNNIRTLLTPINAAVAGAALTAFSTDPQVGLAAPPDSTWLLDEWNAGADPAYTPGTTVGTMPTALARARAKLMERVLNDWRMSFLGSARAYAQTFRPKDFDGDGLVFCSGYLDAAGGPDPDTGLTCWQSATAGDGPGIGALASDPAFTVPSRRLTLFSVTGCMAFQRSHQYKIQVRGELFDNVLGTAVSEQYLESALLIDPDNDINRGAVLPTGLADSTVIMQRPIHNYYRGYLARSYP